jgi:hypothetical protein
MNSEGLTPNMPDQFEGFLLFANNVYSNPKTNRISVYSRINEELRLPRLWSLRFGFPSRRDRLGLLDTIQVAGSPNHSYNADTIPARHPVKACPCPSISKTFEPPHRV